ncbi:MAG: branched-chain amino acid ABC transporter permease, partial [Acinetobacter sp.]|nr:branched-chain amino acid ABC transporter permease [Acinetobacter sp.]
MQSQLIQQKSLGFFRGVQDMLPLSVAVIPWGILAGSAA